VARAYNGALLLRQGLGGPQEVENLALALLQLMAQLGRQRAGRCRTPEAIAVGRDVDTAAA